MPASLGLDHVYLRVHDLNAFLGFFHLTLGLPLTWPVREESFARYAWVNAGNVQLELWQASADDDLPAGTRLPFVAGLALSPNEIHASRAQLALAGVTCKEPKAWSTAGPDGNLALNFTNSLVIDASSPVFQVFFCDWHPQAPMVPWPRGQTTAERRDYMATALATSGGGRIGLVGLRVVELESPDPESTARVWTALSGFEGLAAPDVAIHISNGSELRVTGLVFGVRDVYQADAALAKLGVRTARKQDRLLIDPAHAFGLNLGLVAS